jgi:hypothetical protein
VTSIHLPWTVWAAFVLTLSVCWLLERRIRGRALHGIISVCSLAAAFTIHKWLHPWESPSDWLKGLSAFLVSLSVIELSQAILNRPRRNAT